MKHKKIVFVCTGNTCRSPMAEAALRAELKKRKIAWYTVQSAGISAVEGNPVNPLAKEALAKEKLSLSPKFRSRRLSEKLVGEAFAVVCMEEAQRAHFPNDGKVTSFFELCGREIPDPYGQGEEVYLATLHAICACMPVVIKKIISQQ